MVRNRLVECVVGAFMLLGCLALLFLALKVSGLSHVGARGYYTVLAEFDNIGGLKVRAPVTVSGVRIGEVSTIALDPTSFRAQVVLHIENGYAMLPTDTAANIFTQGLLGANYVSLTPGFDADNLHNGSRIQTTHSALVLENLIGQLVYSLKPSAAPSAPVTAPATETSVAK